MTDTLPDVVVTGQRRKPNGTFPSGPGGGANNPGGVNQWELEEEGDPPPPPEGDGSHPCDDAETARDWNGDAAAAEALRRMLQAAAAQNDSTHDFANREYGAMICEHSNGSFSISPIQWGDPTFDADGNWLNPGQQPTVDINFNSCGPDSVPFAMIHSHPSTGPGGGVPSAADVAWVASINAARGDSNGRIYVVSIGDTSSPYRIWVYDETNAEEASLSGEPEDEVNPEAEPCPGQVIT